MEAERGEGEKLKNAHKLHTNYTTTKNTEIQKNLKTKNKKLFPAGWRQSREREDAIQQKNTEIQKYSKTKILNLFPAGWRQSGEREDAWGSESTFYAQHISHELNTKFSHFMSKLHKELQIHLLSYNFTFCNAPKSTEGLTTLLSNVLPKKYTFQDAETYGEGTDTC